MTACSYPWRGGAAAFAALVAATVTTGCASALKSLSGYMEPNHAARYQGLSPPEFVKARFYTEESSAVMDGVDNFVDRLSRAGTKIGMKNTRQEPERSYKPSISRDEQLVTLPAYYTDVNPYQLTRPRQNLQAYCESARRGRWQLVQRYERDPIAEAQLDPVLAFQHAESDSFAYLERRNGYSGYAPAEAAIAAGAAENVAEATTQQNGQIARQYSWVGFKKAVDEGGFGLFRCEAPDGAWFASVLPGRFYPEGSERPCAMVRIAIRAYVERVGGSGLEGGQTSPPRGTPLRSGSIPVNQAVPASYLEGDGTTLGPP